MPEYAIILFIFLAIAVILQQRLHLRLYKSTRQLILTNALFFIVGVVWDHIAIIGRGSGSCQSKSTASPSSCRILS